MLVGNGWDIDFFDLVIKDGNLIGCGVFDDKGLGMVVYYVLKILKDQGVYFNKKVCFIVGIDEEVDWIGMYCYFEVELVLIFGFLLDVEFLVINGEKGQVLMFLDLLGGNGDGDLLKFFDVGLCFNMVFWEVMVVVEVVDNEDLVICFMVFLDENLVIGFIEVEFDGVYIEVIGKVVYGMELEKGINVVIYLVIFLKQFWFGGFVKDFVVYVVDYLYLDIWMDKFNVVFSDLVMGEMMMNVGFLSFD